MGAVQICWILFYIPIVYGAYVLTGLAFDDWDLDYYTQMFVEKVKRNPTSVECFDLAQSNRYWPMAYD